MWNDLSMAQKSELMKMFIQNGVYDLNTIIKEYDSRHQSGDEATLPNYSQNVYQNGGSIKKDPILGNRKPNANFYQRLLNANRNAIPDWENPEKVATHKMSWATDDRGNAIVYPAVQEINGELHDFTDPKYNHSEWDSYDRAVEVGDTIMMTPKQAKYWTENYKKFYPSFEYAIGGHLYQNGNNLNIRNNRDYIEDIDYMEQYPDVKTSGLKEKLSKNLMGDIQYLYERTTSRGNPIQDSYLLDRASQRKMLLRNGFIEGEEGDYGLVKKATEKLNKRKSNIFHTEKIPVYQSGVDDISRDQLVPIYSDYSVEMYPVFHFEGKGLPDPGEFPIALYVNNKNPNDFYVKGWDLNNYGGEYSKPYETLGSNILDMIGNPVVQTTGFRRVNDNRKPFAKEYLDEFLKQRNQHLEDVDGDGIEEVVHNPITITAKRKKANGGKLGHITPYGQWQYPHQVTTIPSNNITMQGVDYPVVGVSDTGDTKVMLPGLDYLYDGNYVTEYPV